MRAARKGGRQTSKSEKGVNRRLLQFMHVVEHAAGTQTASTVRVAPSLVLHAAWHVDYARCKIDGKQVRVRSETDAKWIPIVKLICDWAGKLRTRAAEGE
jgi:hypothetical protein